MDLIKNFTAFTRKVENFSCNFTKGTNTRTGAEIYYLEVKATLPNRTKYYAIYETTSCPADLMNRAMSELLVAHNRSVLVI